MLLKLSTGSSLFSSFKAVLIVHCNCSLIVTQQASQKPSDSLSCFGETFPHIISLSFIK